MAKGLITHAYLEDTADAIRVLRGESDTYTPDEFGEKIIDAIPTEEVTDSIVSVTDAAAYPAEELEFAIEPVQDLHGYDKPWPAGGGKNLVDESMLLTATGWSKTNTGYYTGGISELNNTFGPSTDGFCPNTTFKANTQYTISITNYVVSGGYINIRIYYADETTDGVQLATSATVTNSTFTTAANKTVQKITTGYIQSSTGQVAWKDFQVEEGSTATSYEPYSNICPISGWTGVNGEQCGKNLVFSKISNANITSDGMISASVDFDVQLAKIKAGNTYCMSTDSTSKVYGFYTSIPTIGSISYNGGRVVGDTIYFTAPITGYVAFRSSNGYTTPQLELGSTATTYEPYQGTSIPITFPALGKNLFNPSSILQGTYDNTTNVWSISAPTTAKAIDMTFKENTQYTFSGKAKQGVADKNLRLQIIYTDSTVTNLWASNTTDELTFAVTSTLGKSISSINCYFGNSGGTVDITKLQIELGDQATTYEPYTNTVYGGKVDVVNGKLTVDRAEVDLGDLTWDYYAPRFQATLSNVPPTQSPLSLCSSYPQQFIAGWADLTDKHYGITRGYIGIIDSLYNNTTDFKAAMQGVQLVYILNRPIEYDITPQQVMMLLGDNNIWCNTGDTTLEYKVDLSRFIAKLQTNQTTPQLSLNRQAVSLDASRDETTQNEDEGAEER